MWSTMLPHKMGGLAVCYLRIEIVQNRVWPIIYITVFRALQKVMIMVQLLLLARSHGL